ncbi:MAG: hypothetical protein EZS28_035914, partial [Streblomastix strix]
VDVSRMYLDFERITMSSIQDLILTGHFERIAQIAIARVLVNMQGLLLQPKGSARQVKDLVRQWKLKYGRRTLEILM